MSRKGGPVRPQQTIGERGPELFVPLGSRPITMRSLPTHPSLFDRAPDRTATDLALMFVFVLVGWMLGFIMGLGF